MPRHFYFGYNRDVSGCSIGQKIAHFILRIIASVSTGSFFSAESSVTVVPPFLPVFLCSVGSFFRQTRIFLDFQAPTSTINQMPMEAIKLVISHCIKLFLEHIYREKMARTVYHDASVGVFGLVGNGYIGKLPILFELSKRLQTIEKSHGCERFYLHSMVGNAKMITLKPHTIRCHLSLPGCSCAYQL